jgi:O-antigen/teichoic acid export membrane protein
VARPTGVRALLTASATVTLATVVANLLSYVLVAVGTRALGPQRYGELAALLGLLAVGAVPALTLQVVLARRVAAGEPGGLGQTALRAAAVVAVVAAAAVPVLHQALDVSIPALIFMAAALPAMTLVGAPTGVVQGLHLFGRLAAVIVIVVASRILGGILGLVVGGTAPAAMAGLAAGAWLSVLAAGLAVRGAGWAALVARDRVRGPLTEVGHAAVTMLAFAALTTVDVLLAKRYLPATDAGLYGAGAIVTKAALWLPSAVVMIALPRLAVATQRREALRMSLAVLAGIGVIEVAGVLLLGPAIFPLAVGAEYAAVNGWLWLFTVEGAVLAITQLVILYRVASTDRLVGALLWTALAAEILVVAFWHGSIGTILAIATVTGLAVVLAGLLVPIRAKAGALPDATIAALG